jgi:hypothetical protein
MLLEQIGRQLNRLVFVDFIDVIHEFAGDRLCVSGISQRVDLKLCALSHKSVGYLMGVPGEVHLQGRRNGQIRISGCDREELHVLLHGTVDVFRGHVQGQDLNSKR